MKRLRQLMLGAGGIAVLSSCSMFGPEKPYGRGDRDAPIALEQPEQRPRAHKRACTPVDYALPWRLLTCD